MEMVIVWCMSSLCTGILALESAERLPPNEQLLRDTLLFLAGLGAVPIMILPDLNVTQHLSLAVRSAIDVGGWADCAAVVAEASGHKKRSLIVTELTHRCARFLKTRTTCFGSAHTGCTKQ